jgi:N6-L-threonylcarbamoyladenine synthase
MRILGIETSCDETAFSIIEASGGFNSPKFKILKSVVASQIKIHRPFGGVVPNLAKREHIKNLPILFKKILKDDKIKNIDLIAVTIGPGLEPALWAGITFAEDLSKKNKIPLIGVNHLEGHLYSFLLSKKTKSPVVSSWSDIFPAVALIVSGGHTILLLVKDLKTWKKLGETRDDAVGEAYDKVARLLGLPYPGGPEIQKLAKNGNAKAINFPRPMIYEKNYDFSFSGLKTAVLYYSRDIKNKNSINTADVAASFQSAAIEVLNKKTERALKEFKAKSVLLSGGVAANQVLRQELKKMAKKNGVQFFVAEQKYNTDNAVMIATAGYMGHLRKKKYPMRANGNLGI